MPVTAFPSSAIVGNLDWTGASSTLTSSGPMNVVSTTGDVSLNAGQMVDVQAGTQINLETTGTITAFGSYLVQLQTPGQDLFSNWLEISPSYVKASTYDEACYLNLNGNGSGAQLHTDGTLNLSGNGYVTIASQAPAGSPTVNLSLDGIRLSTADEGNLIHMQGEEGSNITVNTNGSLLLDGNTGIQLQSNNAGIGLFANGGSVYVESILDIELNTPMAIYLNTSNGVYLGDKLAASQPFSMAMAIALG